MLIINIIESILLGIFFFTAYHGIIAVLYKIANKLPTKNIYWIVPSIILTLFWFIHISFT